MWSAFPSLTSNNNCICQTSKLILQHYNNVRIHIHNGVPCCVSVDRVSEYQNPGLLRHRGVLSCHRCVNPRMITGLSEYPRIPGILRHRSAYCVNPGMNTGYSNTRVPCYNFMYQSQDHPGIVRHWGAYCVRNPRILGHSGAYCVNHKIVWVSQDSLDTQDTQTQVCLAIINPGVIPVS